MLDCVITRFYGSILELSLIVRDGITIWKDLIFTCVFRMMAKMAQFSLWQSMSSSKYGVV